MAATKNEAKEERKGKHHMVKEYVQYLCHDLPLEHAGSGVYLWSEDTRLIFNCHEGTQRYTSEARIRLTRTTTFLLTRLSVWTFFGLPGVLLTIDDAQVHTARIVGPRGLSDWLRRVAAEFFQYRRMDITAEEVDGSWRREESSRKGADDAVDTSASAIPSGCTVKTLWHGGQQPWTLLRDGKLFLLAVALPRFACSGDEDEPRVAYVCWSFAAPKLDVAKARAAGVAPGPKLAQLKLGLSVPSDADASKLVHPSDVMSSGCGDAAAAHAVLVLDVPRVSNLGAATECVATALREYQQQQQQAAQHLRVATVMHVSACYHSDTEAYVAAAEKVSAACFGDNVSADSVRHVFPSTGVVVQRKTSKGAAGAATPSSHSQSAAGAWQAQEFVESVQPIHRRAFERTTAFQQARIHRLHLNSCCPSCFPLRETQRPQRQSGTDAHTAPCHAVQYVLEQSIPSSSQSSPNRTGGAVAIDRNVLASPTAALAESMLSAAARSSIRGIKASIKAERDEETSEEGGEGARPAVTFYGTGSAVPSKYRNVSSFHVTIPSKKTERSVLFDCGEGTLGQMNSFCDFCSDKFRSRVAGLRLVCVSHMHADHHLGVHTLLRYWCELQQEVQAASAKQREPQSAPLLVVFGPSPFIRFAQFFLHYFAPQKEQQQQVCFVACDGSDTTNDEKRMTDDDDKEAEGNKNGNDNVDEDSDEAQRLRQEHLDATSKAVTQMLQRCNNNDNSSMAEDGTGDWRIQCFGVEHPALAHGYRFSTAAGAVDVCFSGDTRPCRSVVRAAQGVALLVHEATFEDELHAEAAAKKHSTVSEAIGVATEAGAAQLLLTHFSQRYPKIPSSSVCGNISSSRAAAPVMSPCFDFLHCDIGRVAALSQYIPVFQVLVDEYEGWGEGTGKRYREQQQKEVKERSTAK